MAAMAIAAVYPVFVELSGTLVAENLLLVFELAVDLDGAAGAAGATDRRCVCLDRRHRDPHRPGHAHP